MTNKSLLKYVIAGLAILGFAGLADYGANAANPGNPAEFNATADVTILSLITISENFSLDFGTITKPSTGLRTEFTVLTTGFIAINQFGGADGATIGAAQSEGEYDITGSAGQAYTLTVTPGACTPSTGLTLSAMTVDVGTANTAAGSGVLSTLDDLNTPVGGKLAVTPAAADGTATCVYTVKAEY